MKRRQSERAPKTEWKRVSDHTVMVGSREGEGNGLTDWRAM